MPSAAVARKAKPTGKDTRFFARVSSGDKRLIEKAAAVTGQSVGAFVIAQAREAATRVVEEGNVIRLNKEESRRLVKASACSPKPPTAAMKKGMKEYRKSVISDVNLDSQRIGDPLHCGEKPHAAEPIESIFAIESLRRLIFRGQSPAAQGGFRVKRAEHGIMKKHFPNPLPRCD